MMSIQQGSLRLKSTLVNTKLSSEAIKMIYSYWVVLSSVIFVFYVLIPLSLRLFLMSSREDSVFQINNSVDLEVNHIPFLCYCSSISMSCVSSVVAMGAVLALLHVHKNKFAKFIIWL